MVPEIAITAAASSRAPATVAGTYASMGSGVRRAPVGGSTSYGGWRLTYSTNRRARSACRDISFSYVRREMCTAPGTPCDSMALAYGTESPNRWYRGSFRPTTPAMTGPVWMPTRMLMSAPPPKARSVAICACISSAALAHRSAWSGTPVGTPAQQKKASPSTSILRTPYLSRMRSKVENMALRNSTTSSGGRPAEKEVKPFMSVHRMVTSSNVSAMRCRPLSRRRGTMVGGSRFSSSLVERACSSASALRSTAMRCRRKKFWRTENSRSRTGHISPKKKMAR